VTQDNPPSRSVPPLLVVGGVVGLAIAGGSFLVLDPYLAAFVAILLVVGVLIAVLAHDWDSHDSFEERELARARKRQEKWDRNAGARAKDRARWEAHQARKATQDGPG
jgi:hypothetical protein